MKNIIDKLRILTGRKPSDERKLSEEYMQKAREGRVEPENGLRFSAVADTFYIVEKTTPYKHITNTYNANGNLVSKRVALLNKEGGVTVKKYNPVRDFLASEVKEGQKNERL